VNRKIDALANVPAKIAPTVDGREFNLRALVRPDGRAEVSLDVVEEKATIQHTLLAGRAHLSKYSGEPISLNLRDADIKDVLHTFAQLTGMNIAVDPAVSGSVTIELHDVPWDQALDLILRQHKLMATTEDGVLRVEPR
jgi:type II secretory pathway component HofQ